MNAWKYVASIKVISDEKIISGSVGSDNEIKIWDFESVTCLQTINFGHANFIIAIIKISNDKKAISGQVGKIVIWNIENDEYMQTINANLPIFVTWLNYQTQKLLVVQMKKQ